MVKRIHVWIHDAGFDESKHPRGEGGQFGHTGAPKMHGQRANAEADVGARHKDLEARGFKHERTEPTPLKDGNNRHYAHPDGSRAIITSKVHPVTGRHEVSSYINTTNQGKKQPPASSGQ